MCRFAPASKNVKQPKMRCFCVFKKSTQPLICVCEYMCLRSRAMANRN